MNMAAVKRAILAHPALARPVQRLHSAAGRAAMCAFHALFGVKKNRVYFSSFVGKAYNDSPRYVCECLRAKHPDAEIVWQLSEQAVGRERVPEGVKCVPPHTPAALKAIATSAVIVENFNRPFYMPKFRDQTYIQLWHGDRALKKILRDMNDGKDYPDGRLMDLGVVGSTAGERLFRSAFGYTGELLKCGLPRNDILLNPDPTVIRNTRRALGLSENQRVLLYAPTFRDANYAHKAVANIDIPAVLRLLKAQTGEEWICLARGHAGNTGIIAEGATDVSRYPEMAELLLISDLLITDYSSCATDFMLLNRPLVLYQPDRREYERNDRNFYFDIDASPFAVADSMESLAALLEDLPALADRCRALYEFFGVYESGVASEAVADAVWERIRR